MATLMAKRPPASSRNTATLATILLLDFAIAPSRLASARSCHNTIGTNRSAFGGFEKVAMPRRAAATTSLRPQNSHPVRGGDWWGRATSLYNQQKYARNAREK